MPGETSTRTEEIGPVRNRVEESRPSAGLTAGEEAASRRLAWAVTASLSLRQHVKGAAR